MPPRLRVVGALAIVLPLCGFVSGPTDPPAAPDFPWAKPNYPPVTREEFQRKYLAWQQRVEKDFRKRSDHHSSMNCREFEALVELGPTAIPYMVEAVEDSWAAWGGKSKTGFSLGFLLTYAIERIARVKLEHEGAAPAWWNARAGIPERYRQLAARWRELRAKEK